VRLLLFVKQSCVITITILRKTFKSLWSLACIKKVATSVKLKLFSMVVEYDLHLYVSVCTLNVPPDSNIVQQNGTLSTFGIPLDVECIPCFRLNGSVSNAVVTTSIQCNGNGSFDSTPTCEIKGILIWEKVYLGKGRSSWSKAYMRKIAASI